jgi:hypothetical protein
MQRNPTYVGHLPSICRSLLLPLLALPCKLNAGADGACGAPTTAIGTMPHAEHNVLRYDSTSGLKLLTRYARKESRLRGRSMLRNIDTMYHAKTPTYVSQLAQHLPQPTFVPHSLALQAERRR